MSEVASIIKGVDEKYDRRLARTFLMKTVEIQFEPHGATPEMDRTSGNIFFVSYLLTFLAVPVTYNDIVQAALCHRLGASATTANLPAAAYFLGAFAPIFLAWIVPYRFERAALVWTTAISAVVLGIVCLTLVFPLGDSVRIGAIINQRFVMGISGTASMVYLLQWLAGETSLEGRIRAFQRTFAVTPLAAVAGSLGAQFVLNRGIWLTLMILLFSTSLVSPAWQSWRSLALASN